MFAMAKEIRVVKNATEIDSIPDSGSSWALDFFTVPILAALATCFTLLFLR